MIRLAASSLLILALADSPVSWAKGNIEKVYYAVRTEDGMTLSVPGESGDQCIDVFGRTPRIEAVVPADSRRHKISAVVEKAHGAKVYPPTFISIGDPGGISSSAYVMIRGQQRFLECGIDTIYVLKSAKRLPED